MNEYIKNAFEQGRLIIFLGAGASFTSKTKNGEDVPMSDYLAEKLCGEIAIKYNNEPLQLVYSAAKHKLGDRLNSLLENEYKHCYPSQEYIALSKFPLCRIYTTNIDDAFDKALLKYSNQEVNILGLKSRMRERDQLFKRLDYIKLNGDINKPEDGFIFSPQEYVGENNKPSSIWYEQVATDFYNYTFLFIGTKLNEPLLQHYLQRYKIINRSEEGSSFLLVPSFTEIEEINFEQQKTTPIRGTLNDFTTWLSQTFPNGLSSKDIFLKSRPEFNVASITEQEKYMDALKDITVVSTGFLRAINSNAQSEPIRLFYKGYKPTWKDILDDVPAQLKNTDKTFQLALDMYLGKNDKKAIFVFGSAGSGKSTLLKQVALRLSRVDGQLPVYHIDNINCDVLEIAEHLNSSVQNKFFLCIEKIADHAEEIGKILSSSKLSNCIIIGAESKLIWSFRGGEYLHDVKYDKIDISQIDEDDAVKILNKIEQFGNWTRLSKLSNKDRIKELTRHSKKQLLIGLLEATSGDGYADIISKEYGNIPSDEHRVLLVLSGIAAFTRAKANEATLSRALRYLGLNSDVHTLAQEMDGILEYKNGEVSTRHFSYIESLFEKTIDVNLIKSAISSYIHAFTVYEHPIIHNVSRSEASIFKTVTNAKSLKKLLKGDLNSVLDIYSSFEKSLEQEGLFLLQYGLALRAYNKQQDAYEKLKTAHYAYPESSQIEHALAQQMLILANSETTNESQAFSLVNDAQEILERLDKARQNDLFDEYPIVTLSEGKVKVMNKFRGFDEAKKTALHYYDLIRRRNESIQDSPARLMSSEKNLMYFITTGKWNGNTKKSHNSPRGNKYSKRHRH